MKVIVMMFDTMRPDHLGCYGNKTVKTPNYDRFASDALLFEKGYAASFPTVPTRLDLFTGRYGEPFHLWRALNWTEMTLPEMLRENGHVCQLINDTPHLINYGFGFDRPFNAWQMIRGNEVDRFRTDCIDLTVPHPLDRFSGQNLAESYHAMYLRNTCDRGQDESEWFAPQVMTATCEWLERNAKHENFFLWVDCFDPHEPWDPPKKYADMYDPDFDGEVPTNFFNNETITPRELQQIRARYAGMVTMCDTWFGKVLDKLDELGITDEVALFLMSDHGTGLGDHGYIMKGGGGLYEHDSRQVWVVRIPGVTKPGTRTKALVRPPNLMPTILDLASIEPPEGIQGKSLTPVLRGETEEHRAVSITSAVPQHSCSPLYINDLEWHYVHSIDLDGRKLFHTASDPGQQNDVLDKNPEQAERLLKAALDQLAHMDCPDWLMKAYKTGELDKSKVEEIVDNEAYARFRALNIANFLPHPVKGTEG